MNEHVCPHCGASMKMYWHHLTPLLVETLVLFYKAVCDKAENCVHMPKDISELTKTQYNNFQKLRLHGLVAKVKVGGVRKRGHWLITRRGAQFLKGELALPRDVQTFRNRVVGHKGRMVRIGDVLGSEPYVQSIDDFEFDIYEFEPTLKQYKTNTKEFSDD